MELIGLNSSVRDIWEGNNNVFKINGLTSDEWVKAESGRAFRTPDKTGFWDIRDKTVQENLQKIWNSSGNPSNYPIDGHLKMIQTASPDSLLQVKNALPQWEKFREITKTSGMAIGIDLETVGKIGETPFGITEIALGSRIYEDGVVVKGRTASSLGESFALGIAYNSEQDKFIRDAISKLNTSGWDSLNNTEQFSLERISMYGQDNYHNIFGKSTPFPQLDDKSFTVVRNLSSPTHDIAAINKGISNLNTVAKEVDSKGVLESLFGYIEKNANDSTIFFGANSEFDIVGLEEVAKQHNIKFDGDKMRNEMVDVVYSARAVAGIEGVSVDTYNEVLFGKRRAATVQDSLEVYGMKEQQTHRGIADLYNELGILDMRNVRNGKSYVDRVIESAESDGHNSAVKMIRHYDSDTVFLINKGNRLDKTKLDAASVHSDTTHSYSVANEFWKLDFDNTGYRNIDGEDKYILSMTSAVDPEIKFSVEKASEQEAVHHIQNNMTWAREGQVTPKQMKEQLGYKYQDLGRRDFEKLLDPAAVGISGKEEANGFDSLKKYLSFNDDLNKWLEQNPEKILSLDNAGVDTLNDFMVSSKSNLLNSYYKKQAFLGMREKLNAETPLLRDVVDSVKSINVGKSNGGNNLINTIVAKKAYNSAIEEVTEAHAAQIHYKSGYTMSDVFGIDIKSGDNINRVNAQKASTAIYDVNRIFGKMTKDEVSKSLTDLAERNVIRSVEANKWISQLTETQSNYGLFTDIGYKLNNVVDRYNDEKNPIKKFTEEYNPHLVNDKLEGSQTIIKPLFQDMRDKMLHKFRAIEGDKRKFVNINNMYNIYGNEPGGMLDNISVRLESNSKDVPSLRFIDTFNAKSNDLVDVTRELAKNLNIPVDAKDLTDEHKLLLDMFTAQKDGELKNYAINKYHDKGVRTFIVNPIGEKQSAYLLMANDKTMNQLIEGILNNDFDFNSRKGLIESGIEKYASVLEMPYINRYEIEQASEGAQKIIGTKAFEMTTVGQNSTFEKFLMPKLEVHYGKNGIESYLNNGVHDFLASFRQGGASALEHATKGEFEQGSKILRSIQNAKFEDMSASSTTRNRLINIDGKKVVKRVSNYGVSDYMHSYWFDARDGLEKLFRETALNSDAATSSTARKIITAFSENMGMFQGSNEVYSSYTDRVIRTSAFKEFFAKRLFNEVGDDGDIINYLKEGNLLSFTEKEMDSTLFDVIRDSVNADDSIIFGGNTKEIINNIDAIKEELSAVLPESAIKKGYLSFARPGDFNVNSGLYSTMRPVYTQQNNAMLFSRDMLNLNGGTSKILNHASFITEKEHNAKETLSKVYDPLGDGKYAEQERMFMTRYKQMSDYELQLKYASMAEDAGISTKLGIQKELYDEALGYMRQDLLSLNEGKFFIAPELSTQSLFQLSDGEKIVFDTDGINKYKTLSQLNKFKDKEIQRGDVIGQTKNGNFIFYEGSNAIINEDNIRDLVYGDGITRVIPTSPQISDSKLMIDGAEKGTSHAVSVDNFVKQSSLSINNDEAFDALNKIFKHAFDGADVIGNVNVAKHANNIGSDTILNTIMTEYVSNGKGQLLTNEMNRVLKEQAGDTSSVLKSFAGYRKFMYDAKREEIIFRGTPKNPVAMIEDLFEKVKGTSFGDNALNKEIVASLDEMNMNNLAYVRAQVQYQNEHMAKSMNLDQRIEQGIRNRSRYDDNYYIDTPETRATLGSFSDAKIEDGIVDGMNGKVIHEGDGVYIGKSWDSIYIDDVAKSAKKFDGTIENFIHAVPDRETDIISDVINKYNVSLSSNRIRRTQTNGMLEKSISGIIESVFYSKEKDLVSTGNTVRVSMENVKNAIGKNKTATTEDLIETIFYKNGKPSETLSKLAKTQDINLDTAKSIRFDLNGMSFMHDGREYRDILIPMQNIVSDHSDKKFWQKQQLHTKKFIHDYMSILNEPGKYIGQDRSKVLESSYVEYMSNISKQLNYLDKDSDLYKAFNRVTLPNSSEFLAQDEIPAIVEGMMDKDMQDAISTRNTLERELSENFDAKKVDELNKTYAAINTKLSSISDSIKNGEVMDMVPMKYTKFAELANPIINGKKYYGYLGGLNRQGFEANGMNFGLTGMQLFDDIEKVHVDGGKYSFVGLDRLTKQGEPGLDYLANQKIIASRLNDLNIKHLKVDENKALMPQLQDYFNGHYRKKGSEEISIRTINQEIANGRKGNLNRIVSVFDDLTDTYLSKEGIFGISQRYPAIEGQPMMKYVLDHTMDGQGLQMRFFSPLASAYTKVDFDGDNMFGALRLNGSTLFAENTLEYQSSLKAYEANILRFNETLAEVIKDGDAINRNNLNFRRQQAANILETFKPDEYEKAIEVFAKTHDYSVEDLLSSSPDFAAQRFVAQQSNEVFEAFKGLKINTIADAQMAIASTTPALRKINVGSLSTPNFRFRSVIDELIKNPDIPDIRRKEMVGWSETLSTMYTKAGGLLSITEQKGIDVKHLVDAMNSAQTTQWSIGMSRLFGTGKITAKSNTAAMKNLLNATNSTLFKASNKELDEMASKIVNTSFSQFQKEIDALAESDGARKTLSNLKAFRAILEFQGIEGASEAWQRSIKGTDEAEETIFKFFKDYHANHNDPNYTRKYRDTVLEKVVDNLKDYTSGERTKFEVDSVYFKLGSIKEGEGVDKAFLYKGKGLFEGINMETIKPTNESLFFEGSPREINAATKGMFDKSYINIRRFSDSESNRKIIQETLAQHKFEKLLNEMTVDGTNVRTTVNPDFYRIKNLQGIDALKTVNSYGAEGWLNMETVLGEAPDETVKNINKYAKAYDAYAKKSNIENTGANLVREMNAEIAANRRAGELPPVKLDDYFKNMLSSSQHLGSEDILNRVIEDIDILGDAKHNKYIESIDFLRGNLYDIMKEKDNLLEGFKESQLDLDELLEQRNLLSNKGIEEFDKAIKPLQDMMADSEKTQQSLIEQFTNANKITVEETHKKLYNLFDNEKQMEYLFRFGEHNGESIVGFGEYAGTKFGLLSANDIKIIKANALRTKEELAKITDTAITSSKQFKLQTYAINNTIDALGKYTPLKTTTSGLSAAAKSNVNNLLTNNRVIIEDVFADIVKIGSDTSNIARGKAKETIKRKTISGSILESIQNMNTKQMKGVGIVVGALAALGIANNMLHNEKTDSPLSPARKSDTKDKANLDGLETKEEEEQAPASKGRKTIYHDGGSGLNFKVKAKTKSYLDDKNNAKLIKMSGGGSASVYSQADTSGVTDNWLANKFAELT